MLSMKITQKGGNGILYFSYDFFVIFLGYPKFTYMDSPFAADLLVVCLTVCGCQDPVPLPLLKCVLIRIFIGCRWKIIGNHRNLSFFFVGLAVFC